MRLSPSWALIALAWPAVSLAQTITLQNDGFNSCALADYQGGFIAGEMGASQFIPAGASLYRITKVQFLYGPSVTLNQINLHVFDDSARTDVPGTELHNGSYQVTGSASAFTEIDLSADHIDVTGPFRVAVEFTEDGDPSIAADTDGTIAADKNFVFVAGSGGGWTRSSGLGLRGDWIIRADVLLNPLSVDAGPDAGLLDAGADAGSDAGMVADAGPDAGVGTDAGSGQDGGGGASCKVTSECPTGQYCLNKTSCTYDCRIDADCGAGMRCTSSGQCEATPASSGCSQGAGDGTVASALGVLGGLVMWRRARRRRA